uniref:Uncharacterized protein n=1 Tax=Anguilla anguilla TaxID=7936 RepID=A0A0E9W4Z1_ANGAN
MLKPRNNPQVTCKIRPLTGYCIRKCNSVLSLQKSRLCSALVKSKNEVC